MTSSVEKDTIPLRHDRVGAPPHGSAVESLADHLLNTPGATTVGDAVATLPGWLFLGCCALIVLWLLRVYLRSQRLRQLSAGNTTKDNYK